jgi:hypothetical protein
MVRPLGNNHPAVHDDHSHDNYGNNNNNKHKIHNK